MRNTIQTFVGKEMYDGLIFPRAKQYKTIEDELTKNIYCLSKLDRKDRGIKWNTKSSLVGEEFFVEWNLYEDLCQSLVLCVVRHEVCGFVSLRSRGTYTCTFFLVVEAGTEREREREIERDRERERERERESVCVCVCVVIVPEKINW